MIGFRQIWRIAAYLFLFVAGTVCAPSQSRDTPAQAELENKILNGDDDAMLKAGTSGNKAFIPLLRQQVDSKHARAARQALARLGDTEAQQDLWCAAVHPRKLKGPAYSYTSDFGYVGGWFGIQGLEVFLDPANERRWYQERKKDCRKNCDSIPNPPHVFALDELARLLPDSPAGQAKARVLFQPPEFAGCMRMWIAEHRDQLRTMEPTGEAVDSSPNACKHQHARGD